MNLSCRRLGPNAPPDDDSPHTNLPPSFPARFMTVLELYRAQRDTPSQVQDTPPSPTFRVQYQLDAPPVYHNLFTILSSQATVVAQEEFEAIRAAVLSPPDTPAPEVVLETVEWVLPSLAQDTLANSVIAMEHVLAQSSALNKLELEDVPPEVWAALRVAVPVRGSSIHDSISRTSSFAEARESGQSSPMDDSPTNVAPPLFLPGSSGSEQLSASYHPQSIKVEDRNSYVIGDHDHPISVSLDPLTATHPEAIMHRLEHASASMDVHEDRLTPIYQTPYEIYNATLSLRSLTSADIRGNSITVITGDDIRYNEAIDTMTSITDELNQAAEGHSHYFLREPLSIMTDPSFPIQSDELRRILDLAAAALSVGPHTDKSSDIWRLLCPSDWFRAATHTMAAILRGCVRTPHIGREGNYPIEPLRDVYKHSKNLPALNTQRDLLEAMALQIAEHLSLDNGPYLPQDSVDSIRAMVWRAHEAQIRAAVAQKANEVEDRLMTMGLSELIDNLLNEASMDEITTTIKDDISLQIRSKYNNLLLAEENKAYHSAIQKAKDNGKARAVEEAVQLYKSESTRLCNQKEHQVQKDADTYYQTLMERAKEQARLKADSEFARLLADKRSAIAPRVDNEIKEEHTKLIEQRRLATDAMLQALTLDAEKESVLAAATCLGLNIQDTGHTAKKIKVDQHKSRPAPITPRGHSNSSTSITSNNSRKQAYSPSVAAAPVSTPARDKQKTPTPEDIKGTQKSNITTVEFSIKQEAMPPAFVTPSTPSVIQHAIDLATDILPSPSEVAPTSRNLSSSIHNEENQMRIDRDSFDPASVFLLGIPPPPKHVSLPPAMSCTPQFGGAEALEDGVAPSCSPEVEIRNVVQISVDTTIDKCLQPLWDCIHRLETLITNRPPRVPLRAGPGYRTEHTNIQAPKGLLCRNSP
jgi:hypothetical protein